MWMTSRSRDLKGLRQCDAQADAMDGADDPDAATAVEAAQPGTDVSTSTSGRPAEEAVQKSGEKGALRRCVARVALPRGIRLSRQAAAARRPEMPGFDGEGRADKQVAWLGNTLRSVGKHYM